jgi:citrate lyase subunit beta/citryl-CoA lyase
MVFVDASDEDVIMRVAELRPDAICWDLEDSTPRKHKDRARKLFPKLASEVHGMGVRVMARINPGMEREDLDAVVSGLLHCAQISKAGSARDVAEFCEVLEDFELQRGIADGQTLVRPVIETAAGVKWAYEIASASPRVTYMGGVHGSRMGDLGVSLGYRNTDTGVESYYVRAKVLVDVRAAEVPYPIGGGGGSASDRRAAAILARDMGYQGMHASAHFSIEGVEEHLAMLHEVFTPPVGDVERWLELMPEMEAAAREGTILLETPYGTFDTAFLKTMREEIALARRIGLV